MKIVSTFALAAALMAAPTCAFAKEAGTPRDNDILVVAQRDQLKLNSENGTASRLGLTARETPATAETITQADLQFRGLRTAREAFADIPGAISGNVPGNPAAVMMRGFSGTLSGFVRHVSGFFTDRANTIHVDGRTTLDAQISWKVAEQAQLTMRGRNLTDAFYGEYSDYPATNVYLGAPRSVELSLATHF